MDLDVIFLDILWISEYVITKNTRQKSSVNEVKMLFIPITTALITLES